MEKPLWSGYSKGMVAWDTCSQGCESVPSHKKTSGLFCSKEPHPRFPSIPPATSPWSALSFDTEPGDPAVQRANIYWFVCSAESAECWQQPGHWPWCRGHTSDLLCPRTRPQEGIRRACQTSGRARHSQTRGKGSPWEEQEGMTSGGSGRV